MEYQGWIFPHPLWRKLAFAEIEVDIARIKLKRLPTPEIEKHYRDTAHSFLRTRDECHCAASVWLENMKHQVASAAQEEKP